MITIECICESNPESYVIKQDGKTIGYARYICGEFEATNLKYHTKVRHIASDDYSSTIPDKYRQIWLDEVRDSFSQEVT